MIKKFVGNRLNKYKEIHDSLRDASKVGKVMIVTGGAFAAMLPFPGTLPMYVVGVATYTRRRANKILEIPGENTEKN